MKAATPVFLLIAVLYSEVACGQTLQEAQIEYQAKVDAARTEVETKWRELITEAVAANDQRRAGQYRQWANKFDNESALYLPAENNGMAATVKSYGSAIKEAGDLLRQAYLDEINRLNEAGRGEEADALLNELTERRFPARLISLQTDYRASTYLFHYGFALNTLRPRDARGRLNCTFEAVSGLANPAHVSLRPINFPHMYFAHRGFRVNLMKEIKDPNWREHATWIQEKGLAGDSRGVSFRSASHPGRYIRVRDNGQAWLDPFVETPKYRQQATFYEKAPLFSLWSNVNTDE